VRFNAPAIRKRYSGRLQLCFPRIGTRTYSCHNQPKQNRAGMKAKKQDARDCKRLSAMWQRARV
jgi:hypothetical protein